MDKIDLTFPHFIVGVMLVNGINALIEGMRFAALLSFCVMLVWALDAKKNEALVARMAKVVQDIAAMVEKAKNAQA